MLSCVARGQEELEIKSKELELKLFLLEEQLESEGTQPLTRLPDALRSDNGEEMEAIKKRACGRSQLVPAPARRLQRRTHATKFSTHMY